MTLKSQELLILLCLVALDIAAPQRYDTFNPNENYPNVKRLRYDNANPPNGPFKLSYELVNGYRCEVEYQWRKNGRGDKFLAQKGSNSYVNPEDGTRNTYRYVIDEKGYRSVFPNGTVEEIPEGAALGFGHDKEDINPHIFLTLMGILDEQDLYKTHIE